MPLLNYTTQIEAEKTLMEISRILTKHGAKAILTEFDREGDVAVLSFRVEFGERDIAFRLPADWRPILTLLERDKRVPKRLKIKGQAIRVAWRIIKDWVEAQMALIETQMVTLDQVFLPYAVMEDGQTVYAHLQAHQLALPASMPPLLQSTGIPVTRDISYHQSFSAIADWRLRARGNSSIWANTVSNRSGNS
ncbi:MAG: hypothetical protein OEU26_09550, partial [Candidatus Tectomicrobia bacterium]|nr:hypothetical protein [Candidatus Tectomicrobia bacterium]